MGLLDHELAVRACLAPSQRGEVLAGSSPAGVESRLSATELRKIEDIVTENVQELLGAWNAFFTG